MAAAELYKSVLFNSANLKAYYRFEASALTTDSSGQGKTLTNNNTVGEGTGVYGGGADFSASNSNKYLSVADNLGVTGGAITMVCWVKISAEPSSTVAYEFISQSSLTNRVQNRLFYYNNAGTYQVYFQRAKSNVSAQEFSVNVTAFGTSAYHQIVYSYDGTTLRGYIDGKYVGAVAASGNGNDLATNLFNIGRGTVQTNYSSCLIDEVAVFDAALSADQIKELYEGRYLGELRPNQFGTTAGLWHLNGNSTDSSGNNYHLTNNNTVGFVAGKFGNCADFGTANSNKYLSVASALGIDGGNITMSGWFTQRTEIAANSQIYVSQGNTNTKITYRITYEYNSGTRRLNFSRVRQGVAADSAYYTITLGTSNIYFMALRYDGTNVKGYINGVEVATAASSGNGSGTTTSAFAIGSYIDGDTFSSIFADEVHVASTALTANQIRTMYALGKGLYY